MKVERVSYRLHAEVDWNRGPMATPARSGDPAHAPDGQCAPHPYADAFQRRLERGRFPSPIGWERVPQAGEGWGVGWKEFVPDYVGPFRDSTAPCATENHVIPAFLEMVFDQRQNNFAN
jgi:hypothetical protein